MNISTHGSIDPYKLAKQQQVLAGKIAMASMPRFSNLLDFGSQDGDVEYKLVFCLDEHQVCWIKGEFKAELGLQCQRCLQMFRQPISATFNVSPVKSEQEAKDLTDLYDPVLMVDGKLVPTDMIEDELILALPLVPMHQENCVKSELQQELEEEQNPFQVLQNLVKAQKQGPKAEDK